MGSSAVNDLILIPGTRILRGPWKIVSLQFSRSLIRKYDFRATLMFQAVMCLYGITILSTTKGSKFLGKAHGTEWH